MNIIFGILFFVHQEQYKIKKTSIIRFTIIQIATNNINFLYLYKAEPYKATFVGGHIEEIEDLAQRQCVWYDDAYKYM